MTSQQGDQARRALSATVATIVARIRNNLGIDIETLAQRSSLAPERLRAIEEAAVAPSVRELWVLARVFEVPFGILIGGSRVGEAGFRVLRADDARVVESGGGAFRTRALLASDNPHEPEVYEVTLAPGCIEEAAAHAHGTFEHIVVVRGTLLVRSEGEQAVLRAGDAFFFRADRAHAYENPGMSETVVHLTMTYAGDWIGDERPEEYE